MSRRYSTRSTIAFFVLAYLISWGCWVPAFLPAQPASAAPDSPQQGSPPLALLQIAGNYGPSIAAILMLAQFGPRGELKGLLLRLRPRRLGLRWYAVALLPPLGVLLPGLTVYGLLRGTVVGTDCVALLPTFPLSILVSGLGEELGWRGYALPRLQERHGVLAASGIVGLLWAIWHLPIVYSSSPQRGAAFAAEFALYALLVVAFSVMMAWAYNATECSLWIAVLMHAALTASGNTIMVAIAPARVGTWVPYTVSVLSACGIAGLVALLTRCVAPAFKRTELWQWRSGTQDHAVPR